MSVDTEVACCNSAPDPKAPKRYDLQVEFLNISEEQGERILQFFRCWQYLGVVGSSRLTQFFVDGDGSDRFVVRANNKSLGDIDIDPDWLDKYVIGYDTRSLRRYLKAVMRRVVSHVPTGGSQ